MPFLRKRYMLQYKILLKCTKGKDHGRKWRFTIHNDTVVIGRLKGCHLVLNDSQVSQSHCLLQVQNNFLSLIDMGSSFGTKVNDTIISDVRILNDNDMIHVGDSCLHLQILSPSQEHIKAKQAESKNDEQLVEEFLAPPSKNSKEPYVQNTSITNLDIVAETNLDISTKQTCTLCQKQKQVTPIGENYTWNYCSACEDFAYFTKVKLAKHYQIKYFIKCSLQVSCK